MLLRPNLRQSQARLLLGLCLALVAGVVAGARLPGAPNQIMFILSWLALLPAFWFWPKRLAAFFILLAAALFGYWRCQLASVVTERDLAWFTNQDVKIVGRVISEPLVSDNSLKLTVAAESIAGQGKVTGNFLLFAPLAKGLAYGDELTADCWLEPPVAGADFDAARYYRRLGLAGTCQYSQLQVLAHNRGPWFYRQIISLRQWLAGLIKNNLPYPEADLGAAMTLGAANKLKADLQNAFSQSGLTHIIAISGLNVSLLVGLLFNGALGLGLSRKGSLWLALVAVSGYVVLVGAPASAVRAGIMGVLFLLAAWLGRLNKLINALAVAAAVSLLVNPWLQDDIGWQLSFLALLGIIYVYPLWRLILKSKWATLDLVLSGLALALAAQAATWPIIAMNFGQVSLIAPLANILAVWTTPFILVAIFAAILLSIWWSWWLAWLPALIFLKYLISVAYLSSRWPLASLAVSAISPWWWAVYYMVLIAAVYLGAKLAKREKNVLN